VKILGPSAPPMVKTLVSYWSIRQDQLSSLLVRTNGRSLSRSSIFTVIVLVTWELGLPDITKSIKYYEVYEVLLPHFFADYCSLSALSLAGRNLKQVFLVSQQEKYIMKKCMKICNSVPVRNEFAMIWRSRSVSGSDSKDLTKMSKKDPKTVKIAFVPN
jgi:hypothetical protein